MDMTARLSSAYAGDQPDAEVWIVEFSRPMRRGMEGPQMSTSMMPVWVGEGRG